MEKISYLVFLCSVLIFKISPAQNLLSVNSFGDLQSDEGVSIAIDNSGNYYVTGSFEGTIDFDCKSSAQVGQNIV